MFGVVSWNNMNPQWIWPNSNQHETNVLNAPIKRNKMWGGPRELTCIANESGPNTNHHVRESRRIPQLLGWSLGIKCMANESGSKETMISKSPCKRNICGCVFTMKCGLSVATI